MSMRFVSSINECNLRDDLCKLLYRRVVEKSLRIASLFLIIYMYYVSVTMKMTQRWTQIIK